MFGGWLAELGDTLGEHIIIIIITSFSLNFIPLFVTCYLNIYYVLLSSSPVYII